MGVVHGGGWFIRSSHVALIYSPKPRIYFIHYAFVGAEMCLGWVAQGCEWLMVGMRMGMAAQRGSEDEGAG